MITREADYSIRAILYLSQPDKAEKIIPVKELAESTDIPYRFLRKIMLGLVNSGFVISVRGRNGGFRLALRPRNITLLDVLHATDPRGVTLNRCLRQGETCGNVGTCPVHSQLSILQGRLDESLQGITFDELHRSTLRTEPAVAAEVAP